MAQLDYSSAEGDAYHQRRHREFIDNPLLTQAMAEFVRRTYFANLKPGSSILEIGAGLGGNLLALKNSAELSAVEPSSFARQHCAALGIPAVSSLDELPAGACYDVVLLRHVIEHVPDPRALLERARGLLAPAGTVIVAVPVESWKAAPSVTDEDHHLYSWTRQTLANLLGECGYSQVRTRLNYRNGRRLLLPVYRLLGPGAYTRAMALLGRLRGLCEIIAEAHASVPSPSGRGPT